MAKDRRLNVLKCVSDETRLKILDALKDGELYVYDIMNKVDREQSLVSHHLQEMRKCGIVLRRREGKKIKYRLANSSISELLSEIDKLSKKICV